MLLERKMLQPLGDVLQCPICYMNYQHLSTFHCGHSCCQNCMSHWVQEIFNRQNLSSDTLISCPNRCGAAIPYEELRQQIGDLALFCKIQELYTLKYLRQTDDVVICPSSGCTYGGFIDRKSCREPLQCEKCHHCWRDPSSFTCWEKIVSQGEGEQWTNLKKVLFTVACPSCGMFISKDGGCQYMRCVKCQYEFCWFCQQSYQGYRHQIPWYQCPQRIWMLFCLYFLMFFSCNFKIGQYYPSLLIYEANLLYWVAVFIADCISVGVGICLPGAIILNRAPWLRYRYNKFTWAQFFCRVGILALFIFGALTILWFIAQFTQNMVWLFLHFTAVLCILGGCFFLLIALHKLIKLAWTSTKSGIYHLFGWKQQQNLLKPTPVNDRFRREFAKKGRIKRKIMSK